MAYERIRIGIVGAGSIVRERHLPGLKKIEGVEIVAVCNRTRESGERVASEFGIPHVLTDWRELVRMEGIDAVVIGTHPSLHHPVTLAALEAGKHVFCQARMARNLQEAREMHHKAEQSGLKTMVCPSPYGLKGHRTMKRLLAEGYLGDPYHLVVRSMFDAYADPDSPLHWRQVTEVSGLNTLALGIVVETVHRWFGYAQEVTALDRLFFPKRRLPDGTGVGDVGRPDSVVVVAKMESGALASFFFSGVSRFAGPSMIEAYGSRGTLRYNLDTDEVEGAQAGDSTLKPIPIPPEEEGGWRVEEDFIALIREGRPVDLTTFAEGVKYTEFT
ncbi:MAG: Gfo/Idh/MocA family oxidoreductase, partial [Candidatus Latescibacteria bacterium]|nr:Gfo/Idh/MocA family oxidoreductase [Candidatus Latescibacterota bacterium]